MQLPRGTFREIRKKVKIGSLLSELGQTRFTGSCSIFSGPATGTFVFREGICILTKFRGEHGNAGWDEMQKYTGEAVDVILATLDEPQIRLSFEFNAASKMKLPGTTIPHHRDGAAGGREREIPAVHHPASPLAPAGTPPNRTVTRRTSPHAAATLPTKPAVWEEENESHHPDPDSVESGFDALDDMDLEHVTSRIRSDCRTLLKELQLEHLMEH